MPPLCNEIGGKGPWGLHGRPKELRGPPDSDSNDAPVPDAPSDVPVPEAEEPAGESGSPLIVRMKGSPLTVRPNGGRSLSPLIVRTKGGRSPLAGTSSAARSGGTGAGAAGGGGAKACGGATTGPPACGMPGGAKPTLIEAGDNGRVLRGPAPGRLPKATRGRPPTGGSLSGGKRVGWPCTAPCRPSQVPRSRWSDAGDTAEPPGVLAPTDTGACGARTGR